MVLEEGLFAWNNSLFLPDKYIHIYLCKSCTLSGSLSLSNFSLINTHPFSTSYIYITVCPKSSVRICIVSWYMKVDKNSMTYNIYVMYKKYFLSDFVNVKYVIIMINYSRMNIKSVKFDLKKTRKILCIQHNLKYIYLQDVFCNIST